MSNNIYDINFNHNNSDDLGIKLIKNINYKLECKDSQFYYPILKKLLKDNLSINELKEYKIQSSYQLDKIHNVIQDNYDSDSELDELNTDYQKDNLLFIECDLLKNNIHKEESIKLINKKCCAKISPILDIVLLIKNHYTDEWFPINQYNYKTYKDKLSILPSANNYNLNNKINSYNNAVYVESFFLYLSSKLTEKKYCPTFAFFYGNITTIKDTYYHDISEDYYDIKDEDWFMDNMNKTFELCSEELSDSDWETETDSDSENEEQGEMKVIRKCNKMKVKNNTKYNKKNNQKNDNLDNLKLNNYIELSSLPDDLDLDLDLQCDSLHNSDNDSLLPEDCQELDNMRLSVSSLDSINSDISLSSIPSIDDMNTNYFVKMRNIPVQINFMEELDETLDDLLDNGYKMSDTEWLSILFQISFGLAIAQKHFKFCHNDLHSSNIMFKKTNLKYLYFHINKNYYRIPTFGRITKIIDFARATFKFKNMSFFSDVFLEGGDAEGQYDRNKNNNGNPSFDLIRLATTIKERLDDNPLIKNLIRKWMVTDDGDNIENEDDDFYLYIKIANECHKAGPIHVLKDKLFNKFIVYPTTKKLKRFIYYYK